MAGPSTRAMTALLLSLVPESRDIVSWKCLEGMWALLLSFVLEAERSNSPVREWFLQDATKQVFHFHFQNTTFS